MIGLLPSRWAANVPSSRLKLTVAAAGLDPSRASVIMVSGTHVVTLSNASNSFAPVRLEGVVSFAEEVMLLFTTTIAALLALTAMCTGHGRGFPVRREWL